MKSGNHRGGGWQRRHQSTGDHPLDHSGQASFTLPWPSEFGPARPVFPTVAMAMFAGAAAVFAFIGLSALFEGQPVRFALGLGGFVFGSAGAAALTRRVRVRRPLDAGTVTFGPDSDGTAVVTVPMSRWLNPALSAALLGGAVFIFARATLRMTRGTNGTNSIRDASGIFQIAFGVACIALAALLALTVPVPRRLVLSEKGIHQNNGVLDQGLQWSSIAAIVPTEADPTQGQSRRRIPMVLVHPSATSEITVLWRSRWFRQRTFLDAISVQPTAYPIDGGLLYYTLRFYWQHPELRFELSSGAAVERMRNGSVIQ